MSVYAAGCLLSFPISFVTVLFQFIFTVGVQCSVVRVMASYLRSCIVANATSSRLSRLSVLAELRRRKTSTSASVPAVYSLDAWADTKLLYEKKKKKVSGDVTTLGGERGSTTQPNK